jgi:hypothetical protein
VNTWKDAIVITSVGVAGLGVVGWPVLRTLRARMWPHVSGTVTESKVEADGPAISDSTSYDHRLRYTYVVDGERYEGSRLSFFYFATHHSVAKAAKADAKRLPRGATIDVRYAPSNPADAVIDLDIPWMWWAILWFAALFAVGGALPMLRAAFGW